MIVQPRPATPRTVRRTKAGSRLRWTLPLLCLGVAQTTQTACATATSGTLKSGSRPNIVFIISDDHRWDCIGAAQNPNVKTPNLDELAREGVHFTQATVVIPQCSPCRAALLTGLPGHQSGWYSNQTQERKVHAPDGFAHLPTVPGLLKTAGYRTVLVGKWHLTPEPWNVGFTDVRTWLPGGGGPYKDVRLAHGNSRVTTATSGFLQEVLATDAVDFIGSPDAKAAPFFMWLALTAPHTPLRPNPEHLQKLYAGHSNKSLAPPGFTRGTPEEQLTSFTTYSGRKAAKATDGSGGQVAEVGEAANTAKAGKAAKPRQAARRAAALQAETTSSATDIASNKKKQRETDWHDYYAAVSLVDEQVGRVRQALSKARIDDNTIVVFMGDNGMMRGSRGWEGKVLPYDESIRVPLIVFAPQIAKHKGESVATVSSLDLPPSFLTWAGVLPPATWAGRDVTAALAREPQSFSHAYCEFADNVSPKFGAVEYRLVRTAGAKLVRWLDPAKGEQFFDLKNDPREIKNDIENPAFQEQIKSMRAELTDWQKRTQDKPGKKADLVSGEGED